ncbi:hypothetical protein Hanom_Chr08g00726821 [Helianthus anomalus]
MYSMNRLKTRIRRLTINMLIHELNLFHLIICHSFFHRRPLLKNTVILYCNMHRLPYKEG